jgi:hypothetical protein
MVLIPPGAGLSITVHVPAAVAHQGMDNVSTVAAISVRARLYTSIATGKRPWDSFFTGTVVPEGPPMGNWGETLSYFIAFFNAEATSAMKN